jgi:ribonuclease J
VTKKSGKQSKKSKKFNNKSDGKNQKKQRKQHGSFNKNKKQGGGKMPEKQSVEFENKQNGKNTQNSKPRKNESTRKTGRYGRVTPPVKNNPVKVSFLGGLNEVGKNMTVYEYEKSMLIVDCGLAFPESDQLGVDFVIPDFSYVERNAEKIKGILITHGHEDHIGALCYLLKKVNVPVYATLLTAGLIMGKLSEHKLEKTVDVKVINPGEEIKLGDFNVEFIHVNHSIPGAVALAIKCSAGTIIQTGDFKIDTNPIDGEIINLSRFAELGNEGVLCLLSDSTNAEQPGYTQSESKVGETFQSLFSKAGNRRIIIATFASNIHRVQQIIDIASKTGRKLALSGRSLENVTATASELGYVHIPEGTLIGIDEIKKYNDEQLVIITTGSQGEAMSALSRMASKSHRK